jgi:hypothetical protein
MFFFPEKVLVCHKFKVLAVCGFGQQPLFMAEIERRQTDRIQRL